MLNQDNLRNCYEVLKGCVELANKNSTYAKTSFTGAALLQVKSFLEELSNVGSKDNTEEITNIVKDFNNEFQKAYNLFFKIH